MSKWKPYPWKAYPKIFKYLRVVEWEGVVYIQACQMMSDGSMDLEDSGKPNAYDVDQWRQLYSDVFNLPYPLDNIDWKQALLEELKK